MNSEFFIIGENYEQRDCPRCGKPVMCTGNTGCWCLSVKIPEPVQDYIVARYDGCLCKDCILELIEQTKKTGKLI
ncbi:MAG: cysteine-rich CWC family protein [Mangrovibacterium sp.]